MTALVLFCAVVLVAPVPLLLVALGLVWLMSEPGRVPARPDVSRPLVALTVVSVLVLVAAVLPFLVQPVTGYGALLVSRLAVLPVLARAFWTAPRTDRVPGALWLGATVGAAAAGLLAIVQVVVLDGPRAAGLTGNAIVFGDLSLAMGAVSLALHGLATEVIRRSRGQLLAASAVASSLGIVASTLSGSRGGWIAAPVLLGLLCLQYRDSLRGLRIGLAAAGTGLVVASAVWLSGGAATQRVARAVSNVTSYVDASPATAPAASSVGARLEAWRSAMGAFVAHPVSGLGWGNLGSHFDTEVALGLRNPRIETFDHAHNQYLGALANGGVLGLLTVVALLAVPGWYFARAWSRGAARDKTLGMAGLIVVGGFAIFALTEAIFENLVPVMFYAMTVAALSSQLEDPVPTAVPAIREHSPPQQSAAVGRRAA